MESIHLVLKVLHGLLSQSCFKSIIDHHGLWQRIFLPQVLWRRATTYDVARVEGQWQFILRVILMWMIHDFSAYGFVLGCLHQRYKTCPICGPDLTFWHLLELGKVVYEGFWCWLLGGHPYWRNQNLAHFNGKEMHKNKPRPIMASDTLKSVAKYEGHN
jgi:hypothetical protein